MVQTPEARTSIDRTSSFERYKGSVRRQLLRASIGGLSLASLVAPVPSALASGEAVRQRQMSAVESGLHKLNHVKRGDKLRILDGKSASLEVERGTRVYKYSGDKITRTKFPHEIGSLVHALYIDIDDRQLACYRDGQSSYCMDLNDEQNKRHIKVNYRDQDDQLKTRPFSEHDIETSVRSVGLMSHGFPYATKGVGHDTHAGVIRHIPVVPLAQMNT